MEDWSQEGRPFRIYTPLGPDVLLLNTFQGEERISQLYRYTVSVISKRSDIEGKDLLLKPVWLALRLLDKSDRVVHGIVSRLSRGSKAPYGYTAYELDIVPQHWTLTLDTGFAIFQNKSVRDICSEMLKGLSFEWKMLRTLDPRPYCFRYRESRWTVIARLLEQEGIWVRFEHKGRTDKLVLADSVASAQAQWGVTKLAYTGPDVAEHRLTDLRMDAVPYVSETRVRTASEFLPSQNVGGVTPSSGDFKPPADIKAYRFEQQMTEHRTGIDHSGGLTPGDVAKLQPDTKVYSRLRQEAAEAGSVIFSGDSRYVGIEVGARVEVSDHPNPTLNAALFVTCVRHSGSNGSYKAGDEGAPTYTNTFEAIPSGVPYRPPRVTPWPVVAGSHTGVVVGPPGEEIYTDKHGRVQVVMKWDRENSTSLEQSCWIRVAQSFAGNRYGMVFLPRIGHEVIVDFLDGNPDNPVVVGSLYNADNLPPWELPKHKTQTGVRTHSTLKGTPLENYNELRFEDKIKEEQIYLQAEKDLDTLVKNNETRLVQNNRTTTIHVNDEKTVDKGHDYTTVSEGEQDIKILKNQRSLYVNKDNNITVDGSEVIKVKGDRSAEIGGNQSHQITGNNTTTIDGQQDCTVKNNDTKTISGGNSSLTVQQGNLSMGASMGSISISAGMGQVSIEGMQQIELKVGGSSIIIGPAGVTIKGMVVTLEGTSVARVSAPTTLVNGDGLVVIKGGITMIN
ncbi:MAG: type VI secretion system tip protein VgrG [Gemmatimonadaceae bacterium]|nr:type VI secretion system tip protein VgrG [Gemmatimonadaceae bacterium]